MRYDVQCTKCGYSGEIQKGMEAPMPVCPECKWKLRRVFNQAPIVRYSGSGFYTTDVAHLEKQVGPERARKFRDQKADIEKRASEGKLTNYERALE